MPEIIKNKEKFHQNSASVKQPNAESWMSKQLLCSFQAENLCNHRQLEAEVKNGIFYKNFRVSGKFSDMSAGTEKGQLGLGYGHKIQSRNLINYFFLSEWIVCNRLLQILASLYT